MDKENTSFENKNPALNEVALKDNCFTPEHKLDFDFLYERGFIPTTMVGAGNTIFNKWGFELNIHCNFVYCVAIIRRELVDQISKSIRLDSGSQLPSIRYKWQLLELERLMEVDNTPNMAKMDVEELKKLIPPQYEYILDEQKEYVKSESELSFSTERGRYKIVKGEKVISVGYNDEEEDYFLCHALLYILKEEKLLPTNSVGLRYFR